MLTRTRTVDQLQLNGYPMSILLGAHMDYITSNSNYGTSVTCRANHANFHRSKTIRPSSDTRASQQANGLLVRTLGHVFLLRIGQNHLALGCSWGIELIWVSPQVDRTSLFFAPRLSRLLLTKSCWNTVRCTGTAKIVGQ